MSGFTRYTLVIVLLFTLQLIPLRQVLQLTFEAQRACMNYRRYQVKLRVK